MRKAGDYIRSLFETGRMPALSAAVASTGGLLWAEALGSADLELNVGATPGHRFRLGSVSKVLTSTAAARLASRGRLDLRAPVSTWLPGLPDPHCATTLEQLLTHRGGIRHYLPVDFDRARPGGSIFRRDYRTNAEILALFINDPLVAPPGETVSYSTFGYTLASLAMEASAGEPFTRLVRAEIGAAFGLPSLAEDDPGPVVPGRARGYTNAEEMRLLGQLSAPEPAEGWANAPWINPAFGWAGAGFLMTPSDLARFGALLPDSPAARISAEERSLLFTPLTGATDTSPPLGLGWRIDADRRGRLRWHHAGATPGGRASLVVYPDLRLSIALASNVMTAPGDVLGPSSNLADAFA